MNEQRDDSSQEEFDGFSLEDFPPEKWPAMPRHVGVPGTLHGYSVDPSLEHMAELIDAAETFARRAGASDTLVLRIHEASRLEAALAPMRAVGCTLGEFSDGHGWDPFIREKITDIDRVFVAVSERWNIGPAIGRFPEEKLSFGEFTITAEEVTSLKESIAVLKEEVERFTTKITAIRPDTSAAGPLSSPNGVEITCAYGWFAYGPGVEKGDNEKLTIYLRFVANGPWLPWHNESEKENAYLAGFIDAQGALQTYTELAARYPILAASEHSSSNQTRLRESLFGREATGEKEAKKGKLPLSHAVLLVQEHGDTGPYRLLNPPSL